MTALVIILVILAIFLIALYNSLVTKRQKVKNAFSQIDVQLQRRFDLVPNLVETVKGYMKHEKETLAEVTQMRTAWATAETIDDKAKLDSQLSGALKTIMAVAENYPDLKANTSFTQLQEELRSTENKISYARQFYNDSATSYNTQLEKVPTNLIANMFGFMPEPLYKVEDVTARQNIKVSFD